jgi:pimeloyl-ACP methyl ester carboxylesterase
VIHRMCIDSRVLRAIGITVLVATSTGCTTTTGDQPAALSIKEIGSMHVGGRSVTVSGAPVPAPPQGTGRGGAIYDPNGDYEAGQMYVQYVKLSSPRAKYPLLLIHGGGLTGVTWETKPDGQPGWQMFFLKAGHDVYVGDGMERGRATWARYPEIYKTEPTTVIKKIAWETFRIGPLESYRTDPAARTALPGVLFPTAHFDQFVKQMVPMWGSNGPDIQAAYNALVQKICPCVAIVHSQGGNFGFTAARNAPDKFKAIVAIEPSGAPDPDGVELQDLKNVPHLVVWGDYMDRYPRWLEIEKTVTRYEDALRRQGGVADHIDLPKAGITGNSHMLMMDTNSDRVAALIQTWFEKQGLMH